ncbi:MAG: hypothetical protein ACK51D_11380 [Cyclobacteriaceae bacterium]|jgi:hypothetical protein
MKPFVIGFLFVLAAIFPILFFPLLALTLVTLIILSPHLFKNGVWGDDHSLKSH